MADEPASPPEECEEGAPEWVVTFGDMMSLLLCFFILLLSFSETDAAKYKEVAGSLEKAFGVQKIEKFMNRPLGVGMKMVPRDFDQAFIERTGQPGKATMDPSDESSGEGNNESKELKKLKKSLESLEGKGVLELTEEADFLIIRLIGQATFASGRASIEKSVIPDLLTIGDTIRKSKLEVIVAGHTDDIPLKPGALYESNLVLSAARAATIVQFFIDNKFISAKYIATMGYGEYHPIVKNDTEENRQKNRRVDIRLNRVKKIDSTD